MQMKEARAGVDGRDFQKIVSVEEEEEIFGEGGNRFFRGGRRRPRMREAKMLRLLRNLLRCRATWNTRVRLAFKRKFFDTGRIFEALCKPVYRRCENLEIETGEEISFLFTILEKLCKG